MFKQTRYQRHSGSRKLVIESLEGRSLLANDLDPSFGAGGKVVTPFYEQDNSADGAAAMASQRDGKLIAGGITDTIFRYFSDGSIDTTFGDQGKIITPGGVNALAVDAQDRIVGVGAVSDEYRTMGKLVRFLPNGQPDASFGDGGMILTHIGTIDDTGTELVIQSDGKILVGIRTNSGTVGFTPDFALQRYNPDGTLDTSFGTGGTAVVSFGGDFDLVSSVVLQPNGRILVGGSTSTSAQNSRNTALARYTPDGSLDTSFDTDGVRVVNLSSRNLSDGVNSVALLPDGRILVGGGASNGINGDFLLARFNSDGSFDTSLNSSGPIPGVKEFSLGAGFEAILDLAIKSNGQFWANGIGSGTLTSTQFSLLMRFNADGSLDTTYDSDGWLPFDFPGFKLASGNEFIMRGDESIVCGGVAQTQSGNIVNGDLGLVGFSSSGAIDSTFGIDGFVRTDGRLGLSTASRGTLQPDGKLIVVGSTSSKQAELVGGYEQQWAMARYNTDGSLDSSFGGDGRVTTRFPNGLGVEGIDVAVQPDGRIVMLGAGGFGVGRYLSDGTLDTSFGVQGIRTTTYGTALNIPKALAIAPNGKIISIGYKQDYAPIFGFLPGEAVISQLNADGSIDTSFGTGGVSLLQVNGIGSYATSVATQGDGKILVAGYTEPASPSPKLFVARYLVNGTLDTSFGVNGVASYGTNIQFILDMKLQSDGKIVLAGDAADNSGYHATVTRLTSDGSLDTTFGTLGVSQFAIGTNDTVRALAIQADGKIVVSAGSNQLPASNSNQYFTASVARLLPNGSLDISFGTAGTKMLNLGPGEEFGDDVLIQSDGKILIVGDKTFRFSPNDRLFTGNFMVARLNNGSLTVSESNVLVSEGAVASNTGSWSGIATITASAGTVVKNDNGTWSWQYSTSDGPDQSQTITITASDGSGVSLTTAFSLVVQNAAPSVTVTTNSISVNEGQAASNSGSWSDPGTDAVIVTASIGTVTTNSNGTWSWQFASTDGPDQSQTVTITATDSDGLATTLTFALLVSNVAPTLVISGAGSVNVGVNYVLTLSAVDPGNDTISSWRVNWGDGVIQTFPGNPTSVTHAYTAGGISRTISATATDEDGTFTANSIVVFVNAPDPGPSVTIEGRILKIVGTNSADIIRVVPQGEYKVKVLINGTTYGPFFEHSFNEINIFGKGGDDDLEISGSIDKRSIILGGDGNDRIKGGSGNNVLVGGQGDDRINGGSDQDILIGSQGEDRLIGEGGGDILIGGYTIYDSNLAGLRSLLAEWTRGSDYRTRQTRLRNGGGLNGAYVLTSSTVKDDNASDRITGASGRDWYFAQLSGGYSDILSDRRSDESVN